MKKKEEEVTKKNNELIIRHYYGVPARVEIHVQIFYAENPNIEVISREMSVVYDPREECIMAVYFITYKEI